MRNLCLFVCFAFVAVFNLAAQNWDVNTLHRVNSWDSPAARNYFSFISRSEPYIVMGVPVAMAVAACIKNDRRLMKDALYVGTSVVGTFALTYGLKYLIDRPRPYVTYPDRVHPYSYEDSPSFPSGHTATAFALADPAANASPFFHLATGSVLLGGFFLITDPANAPSRPLPMFLFGLVGGALVMLIRKYGVYADGAPFAILLANLLAPQLDLLRPKPFGGR